MRARSKALAAQRTDNGAVAVEFALLVPLLLLVLLGTMQYGIYFYARQGGSDVARDAARRAAVGDPVSCTDFRSTVQGGIDELAGSGTTDFIKRSYTTNPVGRTGDLLPGDEVTVEVQFQSFDMNLPFIPLADDGKIYSKVKVRLEYVPEQPETCS
jgi:hypothetical protein